MARKCGPKKKPKAVVAAPAEGQESRKVSFEVGGKKGSWQENQVDVPGHVLDQAFLVRVNAPWKGWQHQRATVLVGTRTCPAALWYWDPQFAPNY